MICIDRSCMLPLRTSEPGKKTPNLNKKVYLIFSLLNIIFYVFFSAFSIADQTATTSISNLSAPLIVKSVIN